MINVVYENRASSILYKILKENVIEENVILPSNVCPIVVATILKANFKPLFIDIDKNTLLINDDQILKLLNSELKIGAVLYVNTYGVEIEINSLYNKIKNYNKEILVIQDKCLCTPITNKNNITCDVELYSTGYSKVVDFSMWGYAYLKKNILYNFNFDNTYSEKAHTNLANGFNSSINQLMKINTDLVYTNWLDMRKPTINLTEYFNKINAEKTNSIKIKKKINLFYDEFLKDKSLGLKFNAWRYNIIVENKEKIIEELFKNNLFASSHYFPSDFIFFGNVSINSMELHSKVINLFNDKYIYDKEYTKIKDIIKKINDV